VAAAPIGTGLGNVRYYVSSVLVIAHVAAVLVGVRALDFGVTAGLTACAAIASVCILTITLLEAAWDSPTDCLTRSSRNW
jgi:hypothetical protein